MKYTELKQKHQKELADFKGIIYAFSDKQLESGLKSLGLTIADKYSLEPLGFGGFILKTKKADYAAMIRSHKIEMDSLFENPESLLEALVYELENHEYCITIDDSDALCALGLDLTDIRVQAVLPRARKIAMEGVQA